jgi:hypothetical protein
MAMLAALLACGVLQDPDTVKVTVEVRDRTLAEVLKLIETSTRVPIALDEAARKKIDPDQELVSATLKDVPVTTALKLLVLPRGLDVKVVDRKRVVLTAAP